MSRTLSPPSSPSPHPTATAPAAGDGIRPRRTRRLFSAAAIAVGLALAAGPAAAEFAKIGEMPFDYRLIGITPVGSEWYLTDTVNPSWLRHDGMFNLLDIEVLEETRDPRSITYDSSAGTLFVGDGVDGDRVFEYSLDGTVLGQFETGRIPNGLAFDASDDTLWIAYFEGAVERRNRAGEVLDSFETDFDWVGLSLDTKNGTLLLLDGTDHLYEFSKSGALLNQTSLVDPFDVPGNGVDIHYDSESTTL